MLNPTLPRSDQPGDTGTTPGQPAKSVPLPAPFTRVQADVKPAARATSSARAKARPKRTRAAAAKRAVTAPVKQATKRKVKPAAKSAVSKTPAKKSAAASAARKPSKADKKSKPKKKDKLIRDSFTMPESEYGLFSAIKKRCLAQGLPVKKSEVLRAAIVQFAAQSDGSILRSLRTIEVLKTGRPPMDKKDKK